MQICKERLLSIVYGGCYNKMLLWWCLYLPHQNPPLFLLQVAIKIIDKTQLNPTSLQKVSLSCLYRWSVFCACAMRTCASCPHCRQMRLMLQRLILSACISSSQASKMWTSWPRWCNSMKYRCAVRDLKRFRFILSCFLLRGGRNGRAADRERAHGMWCRLAGARDWMEARRDLCSPSLG